jgi:hypothetical protein
MKMTRVVEVGERVKKERNVENGEDGVGLEGGKVRVVKMARLLRVAKMVKPVNVRRRGGGGEEVVATH